MVQAAPPPIFPPAWTERLSQPKAGPLRSCQSLEARLPPSSRIEELRRRVRELERHTPPRTPSPEVCRKVWTLGAPAADALLGHQGLEPSGVHEVKPAAEGPAAATAAAAHAFALRLAVRRLNQLRAHHAHHAPRILWCTTAAAANETGRLYGPGLKGLGLSPRAVILVETARKTDTLWAIEEGLRSNAVSLVIGMLDDVALTPARRLSLAAEQNQIPCLLMTHARGPSTGATATRWRAGPAVSNAHLFDARAPGAARFSVSLERCRRTPSGTGASFALEWSDETCAFRLAADVAHRAPQTAVPIRRAG